MPKNCNSRMLVGDQCARGTLVPPLRCKIARSRHGMGTDAKAPKPCNSRLPVPGPTWVPEPRWLRLKAKLCNSRLLEPRDRSLPGLGTFRHCFSLGTETLQSRMAGIKIYQLPQPRTIPRIAQIETVANHSAKAPTH